MDPDVYRTLNPLDQSDLTLSLQELVLKGQAQPIRPYVCIYDEDDICVYTRNDSNFTPLLGQDSDLLIVGRSNSSKSKLYDSPIEEQTAKR